jgi:hypothetical protein
MVTERDITVHFQKTAHNPYRVASNIRRRRRNLWPHM